MSTINGDLYPSSTRILRHIRGAQTMTQSPFFCSSQSDPYPTAAHRMYEVRVMKVELKTFNIPPTSSKGIAGNLYLTCTHLILIRFSIMIKIVILLSVSNDLCGVMSSLSAYWQTTSLWPWRVHSILQTCLPLLSPSGQLPFQQRKHWKIIGMKIISVFFTSISNFSLASKDPHIV